MPVNVIAIPEVISSFVGNNWKLFSSMYFANTVVGKISVVTPALFTVEPIDTAVAAIPINVVDGSYVISSFVSKKWLGIVNIPVDFARPAPSGLNVLLYIGVPSYFRSNLVLFALLPSNPSNVDNKISCSTEPYVKMPGMLSKSLAVYRIWL